MSASRIRGIAKLLDQVRAADSSIDEAFEVQAEDEVPFVQLGHWIALSGVSAGALSLYWMLAMHLNGVRGDRYVWPTTSVLAHMLGYSRGDKIKRFVDELVAIGALVVIAVPDGDGPQKRNVYRLRRNPPPGYAGPTSLSGYYAALQEKYEEETAGQPVCPETGVDACPETGGHVTPETGAVTTRSSNKKKDEAPAARRAVDAGGQSSGSRRAGSSGSAAADKTSAARAKVEREAVRAVREEITSRLPDLAKVLPASTPRTVRDAILAGLALGTPAERTPEQLVAFRVLPRWDKHWAALFYAGELPAQPVGPLVRMLSADKTDHVRCDERVDVDTGEECRACAERRGDRTARRGGATEAAAAEPPVGLPRPRPAAWWECRECSAPGKGHAPEDGLCRECRVPAGAGTPASAAAPF